MSPPRVFLAYKIRSLAKETSFWSAFGLWFSFQPVLAQLHPQSPKSPASSIDAEGAFVKPNTESRTLDIPWTRLGSADDNDLFIFIASRRPESYTWQVPSTDEQLLAGVGAWGTTTCKGDDTFEGLLLMGLDTDI